jgi:AcrR family transcriptional regulator
MSRPVSARKAELLEGAYAYVLDRGLAELSLRPLAAAVGSSPRVLLFLFGSKEGLVRALLARARADELSRLEHEAAGAADDGLADVVRKTWRWLSSDQHRPLLALWVEAYGRSLTDPDGPWAGFAAATVGDWLGILAAAQPERRRRSRAGMTERVLALAVLRGALLDLLATGDRGRTEAAVLDHVRRMRSGSPDRRVSSAVGDRRSLQFEG